MYRLLGATAMVATILSAPITIAAENPDIATLHRELQSLKQEYETRMRALEQRLEAAEQAAQAAQSKARAATQKAEAAGSRPPSAQTALDTALAEAEGPTEAASPATTASAPSRDIWSRRAGAADLRLIQLSLDTMVAAGGSTANDSEIKQLQGGAHDPKRRGFTLQQAELSAKGAVDPYLSGEAYIVASEEDVELEEAYFTTLALPYTLQAKGGYFLTEFGMINPTHPHAWDWIDQPVINTRMFGGEGTRAAGLRLNGLLPTPWYSEWQVSTQDPTRDQMVSFEGDLQSTEDGAFDDFGDNVGIGGFERVNTDSVDGIGDLAWMARWANASDLGENASGRLGLSAMHGPNTTGPGADSWIVGTDLKLSWRPSGNFRGWPFLSWKTEAMRRFYEVDNDNPRAVPGQTGDLRDWGLYSQLLYGFTPQWAAGLRVEYANGNDKGAIPHDEDPFRDQRYRISPMLAWYPSEYTRLRLQYDYDNADHLRHDDEHTVWLSMEWQFGRHPAHKY